MFRQKALVFRRFCIYAVLACAAVWCSILTISSFGQTAVLVAHEHIEFVELGLWRSVPAAMLLLGLLCLCSRGLERAAAYVWVGCIALLGICAAIWLLAAGTQQMYDFAYVLEAAQLFARGNYKPMTIDYFNVCSYQLGICLPMEIVLRVFPQMDLNMFMQAAGVVLVLLCICLLAQIARELFSAKSAGRNVVLLGMLFLPVCLYPMFTYSTLPMFFFALISILCFVRYLRTRKGCYGWGYALGVAIAYMLKPNAAILLTALCICVMVELLVRWDGKLVCFTVLGVMLAVLLARGVIWQYEWRSGVKLTGNVSMTARFAMGLQEGGGSAGWYNCYIDQFFPFDVTPEQEKETALADIHMRISEMCSNPRMAFAFFRDKLLSQWTEPTCGTMWYGALCEQRGPLAEAAKGVYAQGSDIRRVLEGYMACYQRVFYLLAGIGVIRTMRRKPETMQMLPALCVLGGCLYHMLFEAKSQYAFIYLLLLMPYAACGLELIVNRCGIKKNSAI